MQRLENEPIKKIDFNRFWIGDWVWINYFLIYYFLIN
jgi:hypothetical protein